MATSKNIKTAIISNAEHCPNCTQAAEVYNPETRRHTTTSIPIYLSKKFLPMLILLGVMCCATSTTLAQDTIPCSPKTKGLHYTYPFYYYTPVLQSDMPYEIMASYIIMDSVLRNPPGTAAAIGNILRRLDSGLISADNDTLNYACKYLYTLSDYDPLRFFTFMTTPRRDGRLPAMAYYNDLCEQFVLKNPNGEQKNRILKSFFILHIYVDTTTLFVYDTTANEVLKDFTIVYAKVLDTIKGQILPDANNAFVALGTQPLEQNINEASSFNSKRATLSRPNTNYANIVFDYCNQWLLGGGDAYITLEDGSVLGSMYDENGNPWVKPHNEYIVLLAPNPECVYDTTNLMYYALWPVGGSYSHGMYPIKDGKVLDAGNVWGWGTSVPINEFKNHLNDLINSMKHYGE